MQAARPVEAAGSSVKSTCACAWCFAVGRRIDSCIAFNSSSVFTITMQTQSQPTATMAQPANLTFSTFPAPSKTVSNTIAGVPTQVTALNFSDKLVLTISQSGRLNHWLHVPLSGGRPLDNGFLNPSSETDVDASLLPFAHLTATTVLGGTRGEFEVLGQTLATTLATALLMRNPEEQRMVVLGLGLEKADQGREAFDELIGLCLECL